MLPQMKLLHSALLALVLLTPGVFAQEAVVDVAAEQTAAYELIDQTSRTLRLMGGQHADADEYARHPASLLRWSNPSIGRVYGDTFVWTQAGRPRAIVSIYKWCHPYQDLTLEFCSLSDRPIAARRESLTFDWRTEEAGISWRTFNGAEAPLKSRTQRQLQMKRLADRFQMKLEDARNDDQAEPQSLRLLSRPLYRYPESAGDVDGAIFGYVLATDPECIVVIEAQGDQWKYAVARMNSDPLAVSLDAKVVHTFPDIPFTAEGLLDPRRPYCCAVVSPKP